MVALLHSILMVAIAAPWFAIAQRVPIATDQAPGAIGPYSQAIFDTANSVLYAAGQIGLDPKTGTLAQGVTGQAVQALRNVAAIFEAARPWAGPQFSILNSSVCLVLLANISDYAEVNKAYVAAFKGADAFPARAAFQVAELPKAARVEIKCTGVARGIAMATPNAPAAIGPYSQGILDAGTGVLYAAGQIGLDPKTGTLAEGVHDQAVMALRNAAAIFEAARPWAGHHFSILNATECLVALADIGDYAEVNVAYAAAFAGADAFPARVAFQVAALPKAARVEIMCTGTPHRIVVATSRAPAAIGPYSQGTFDTARGVLYAAGQIGLDENGKLAADVTAQAVQALRNVAAIFEAAPGPSSLLNATECLVALANISDYANVNKAYVAAFKGADAFPARAAFQVAALPKAALVEVKCTGVMHDRRQFKSEEHEHVIV